MKLVKLSLVAALAAGAFGALEAKSLEEAIKNVDVSGYAHYRFDQASVSKNADADFQFLSIDSTNRPHRFRAFVTTAIDAGDGFKVVGQVMYNNDRNGGWADATASDATAQAGLTSTKNAIVLKQAYVQYDAADLGVSVLFGKQQLGTIWTDDLTGIAAKVLVNPTDGLTIAAFGVDSFQGSGMNDIDNGDIDAAPLDAAGLNAYDKNMYGAAVLANVAGLDAQVWGAYWDKVATLYAVNLKYTLGLGDASNVGIKATYLGNAVASDLKDDARALDPTDPINIGNGNLIDGRLFANFGGLDARLGGIFYGSKDKYNVNTLEDTVGPDLYIGREMFYVENTSLVLSYGRNTFGYVGVGYTLPADVRVGVQGVYGQNVTAGTADDIKDTRWEAVGEVSWQVNKNLSFLTYYSYLDSSVKNAPTDDDKTKQTVRFQAAYKF